MSYSEIDDWRLPTFEDFRSKIEQHYAENKTPEYFDIIKMIDDMTKKRWYLIHHMAKTKFTRLSF